MIYASVAVGFGVVTALVGRAKGSSWFLWGLIGAVFPVLGLIGAAMYRSDRAELRRQCPGCDRVVKLHDALCMRCGTELDFPEVAIESESEAAARSQA